MVTFSFRPVDDRLFSPAASGVEYVKRGKMRYLVWSLVALLVILHQDYWQWENGRLVFGFLPYPLLYHAALSFGAAIVWGMATKYCWPHDLDVVHVEAEEAPP